MYFRQTANSFVAWAVGLIHEERINFGSIAVPMTASGLQGEKPMAIEVW